MYSLTGNYDFVANTFPKMTKANLQEEILSVIMSELINSFNIIEDSVVSIVNREICKGREVVVCGARGENATKSLHI